MNILIRWSILLLIFGLWGPLDLPAGGIDQNNFKNPQLETKRRFLDFSTARPIGLKPESIKMLL